MIVTDLHRHFSSPYPYTEENLSECVIEIKHHKGSQDHSLQSPTYKLMNLFFSFPPNSILVIIKYKIMNIHKRS